ncbi:MAG: hypothetical protein ACQESC_04415 [Nanobdellota archaeon]
MDGKRVEQAKQNMSNYLHDNILTKTTTDQRVLKQFQANAQESLKAEQLLDNYEYERAKRSRFQYEMGAEVKRTKANTSLQRAKDFHAHFRKLLPS